MTIKQKNSVLIILVIGIWGFFGFKILQAVWSVEQVYIEDSVDEISVIRIDQIQNDTIEFVSVTRDPFLGDLYTQKKRTKPIIQNVKAKQIVEWPNIVYKGVLKADKTINNIYILDVNSKEILIKSGQKMDDIKLLKANPSKITIKFSGEIKSFEL